MAIAHFIQLRLEHGLRFRRVDHQRPDGNALMRAITGNQIPTIDLCAHQLKADTRFLIVPEHKLCSTDRRLAGSLAPVCNDQI